MHLDPGFAGSIDAADHVAQQALELLVKHSQKDQAELISLPPCQLVQLLEAAVVLQHAAAHPNQYPSTCVKLRKLLPSLQHPFARPQMNDAWAALMNSGWPFDNAEDVVPENAAANDTVLLCDKSARITKQPISFPSTTSDPSATSDMNDTNQDTILQHNNAFSSTPAACDGRGRFTVALKASRQRAKRRCRRRRALATGWTSVGNTQAKHGSRWGPQLRALGTTGPPTLVHELSACGPPPGLRGVIDATTGGQLPTAGPCVTTSTAEDEAQPTTAKAPRGPSAVEAETQETQLAADCNLQSLTMLRAPQLDPCSKLPSVGAACVSVLAPANMLFPSTANAHCSQPLLCPSLLPANMPASFQPTTRHRLLSLLPASTQCATAADDLCACCVPVPELSAPTSPRALVHTVDHLGYVSIPAVLASSPTAGPWSSRALHPGLVLGCRSVPHTVSASAGLRKDAGSPLVANSCTHSPRVFRWGSCAEGSARDTLQAPGPTVKQGPRPFMWWAMPASPVLAHAKSAPLLGEGNGLLARGGIQNHFGLLKCGLNMSWKA